MKKLTLIFVLTIFLFTSFINLSLTTGINKGTKRKVLLELFTATWCGPCAKYGPYVDETFNIYGQDKVILLRNQVWDDGLDTEETNNRCNFYGVSGVPTLYVNGKFEYHPSNYQDYRKKIDDILKTTSPISIKLNAFISQSTLSNLLNTYNNSIYKNINYSEPNLGYLSITLEVLDNISLKEPHLIVVLYEKLVNFEGTNKEKTHKFVIRDYIYDEVGELIKLKKGDILKFVLPLNIKKEININDFGVAAFVQDFQTLEVIQAESSDIKIISNLTPPVIISPKNKQIFVNNPQIKFLSNYKKIRFQISDKEDFSNVILDKTIETKEFEFIDAKDRVNYYLRAKSIDDSKESDWSDIIIFSKDSTKKIYSFIDINYDLYGGNLSSIVQDPKNPDILYVGSYGGGIYKSLDRGNTWFKSSFGIDSLYVNSLDIDKNNTNIILAGTDGGVYISFNGGNFWLNYGLSYIKKILITSDSKTIYAITSYNLYKSNDYCRTWIDITPKLSSHNLLTFEVDPKNSSKILLSTYSYETYLPSIYYSTNGGETWNLSNIPILNKYTRIRDIEFDLFNNSIIYLSTKYENGLLTSNDGGKNFKTSSFNISQVYDSIYNIKIHPLNNSIIFLSTFTSLFKSDDKGSSWKEIYKGNQITDYLLDKFDSSNVFITTYGGEGVLKSSNGGYSWEKYNKGLNTNKIFSITNNDNIKIQTSSGFYVLDNNNWINKFKKFKGYYSEDQFYYVDYKGKLFQNNLNKNELIWFYYFYGNIIGYSSDGGNSWSLINRPHLNGHIYDLDVDFINRFIYIIFYDYNNSKYFIYKGDFKGNWEKIDYIGINVFYEPIIKLDPKNTQILYIGLGSYWDKDSSGNWVIKGGGLYKSTDSGKNWKLISLKEEYVYNIFIDPKDSNKIYTSTDKGFKRSTDGGLTWKVLFNEMVDTMTFHSTQKIIYANRGRNLIKSEDDGLTWQYIPWDYSIDPVKFSKITSLAIDINDPNSVYIGTDACGIYKYGLLEAEKKLTLPSPPTLSYELKDKSVLLKWTKSEDGSYPVNGYSLYKKTEASDWSLLRNFDKNTFEYQDFDIESGKTYYYYIQAFDSNNNLSEKSNIISVNMPLKDTTPPLLEITFPQTENYLTNNSNITISGKTLDNESGIKNLTINNIEISITSQGDFNYNVNLTEGENNFLIISKDKENNETRKNIKIICDLTSPQINLILPSETSEPTILISGTITDNLSGIKYLKINNINISISSDNKFTYSLNLTEGVNNIIIESEDNAGNKISKNYSIKYKKQIIIKLQIGNMIMLVNDKEQTIDVPPQIIEGRTYLPIRWIAEPLGAEVVWDSTEKKVTILFKDILIELWIGKNIAKVNNNYKLIDPQNPKVVPLIINGRTMLPIRFVAENLGCKVEWNATYKTITITYP